MVNILYTNSYLVGIQDNKDVLEITLKRGEAKRKGEKIYPFERRVPKNSKER